LKTVFDPEIPINIVDLGLVYKCDILALEENDKAYQVYIVMTLTAPGCGMGPVIVEDAKSRVLMIPEVSEVEIELVFDPPWDRSMMSEAAQLELGMFW
nr:iron-sulfur cluster assembly protein [Gammaproteobacteria bacterium]